MTSYKAMALMAAGAGCLTLGAADSGWALTPLGEPGSLVCETKLRHEPKLVDRLPERGEGIVLVDGDTLASVVIDKDCPTFSRYKEIRAIAEEIRWHLSEMCGRELKLVDAAPEKGPYIEVKRLDVPSQTAVVKIDGRRVTVGGDGPGIGHAATYFLESLGVRYLWPGKSGKVIPKKPRIALPAISLEAAPKLDYIRRIWAPSTGHLSKRGEASLRKFGIDRKEFLDAMKAAYYDRPGNRGFWSWHGFDDAGICRTGSKPSVQNQYGGGHNFNDYWDKYGKDHPEWFALQPDGVRVIRTGRPRLCVANPGLVDQIVKDTCAHFEKHPNDVSASLCMPDGNRDSSCMCEECRKLDPVNASPIRWGYYFPERVTTNYVALTDRYLSFCNRVAERVLEKWPGKQFKIFVYSSYSRPPVKVKPHPSLVLFYVDGSFGPDRTGRELPGIAALSAFGNPLVWRPNVLRGIVCQAPVNFARQLYDDVVRFKENNVRGVSFDCCNGDFALRGWIFYMLGRSLFNYDDLSYEAQLADYCSQFGKAAPHVRTYLAAAERIFYRAVAKERGADGMMEDYPLERMQSFLDLADAATKDEPEANARVKFLMKGMEIARAEKRFWEGWRTGDWKKLGAARKEYFAFVKNYALTDPVALHPGEIGFKGPWVHGAPYRPPKVETEAAAKKDWSKAKGHADDEGNFEEEIER